MRKFKFILFLILCFSCSNEDFAPDENENNNDQEKKLLVKSIKISGYEGNPNNGWNYTENYTYEGNKIEQITTTNLNTNEVKTTNYTYTDNLITNIKTFDQNNSLINSSELLYDSNKRIISLIYTYYYSSGNNIDTIDFTYQANGSILYCNKQDSYYYGNLFNFNQNGDISTFTYNSDLDSIEACNSSTHNQEGKITYNDSPYPFKNITGIQFFSYFENIFSRATIFGYNKNATRITNSDDLEDYNWTYDFNEFGYPRNIVWTYDDSLTETIDIDYH